ncbi:hypothetical protein NE237_024754 [Protea cynaroides]|uniref:Uncharacterized protein n=1 Tax=Protea cynaroides TaxID=273540 RepID=A0A9Q0H149_9MAGN|nr:hypothetical protein NE237_024754 [Protea cynaroides]
MVSGCCFCRKSSSSSFNGVRVVHINGFVEDLEDPVTVGELIGKTHEHFVSTSAQLLSFKSSKTLPQETQLQQGQIYFLLPFSILESESSVDLIYLSNRLTAIAKRFGSKVRSSKRKCLVWERSNSTTMMRLNSFPPSKRRSNSTTMMANPFSPSKGRSNSTSMGDNPRTERINPFSEHVMSAVAQESWKPILDSITERSFGSPCDEVDLSQPLI